MKQLVELDKHAEQFTEANAEVVVVFREEKEGVEGLKKIKTKNQHAIQIGSRSGQRKNRSLQPRQTRVQ